MKKTISLILLLSLIALVGCQSTKQESLPKQQLIKETITQEFDMPSLLRKSVSDIKEILGKPTRETSYEIEYSGEKFQLYIEPKGDKVNLLFICDKSGATPRDGIRDFNDFLIAGNMVTNSEDYELKGSKALIDSSKYTCVTIIEK